MLETMPAAPSAADESANDYRFLEMSAVFEQQTGLVAPLGRTARELVPDLESRERPADVPLRTVRDALAR